MAWQERSSKRLEQFGLSCCNTISYWSDLMHHAFVLARIRLTRMAAERGPILSGACGQGNGFQTVNARVLRVRAPAVSTGSSVSGV
jgi:hypothetical protein